MGPTGATAAPEEASDGGAELVEVAVGEEVLAAAADGHSTTGALLKSVEGLLLHPSLALARDAFCEQHCQEFEAFKAMLTQAQQDGTSKSLQELVLLVQDAQAEGGEMDQEALVALSTDFEAFAAAMAERATADAEVTGEALSVQGSKAVLHTEEQEDGEERADLNEILAVCRVDSEPLAQA